MNYETRPIMTNGEHTKLLKEQLESAPKVAKALNYANALVAVKELYNMGEMTADTYKEFMMEILSESGFKFNVTEGK